MTVTDTEYAVNGVPNTTLVSRLHARAQAGAGLVTYPTYRRGA